MLLESYLSKNEMTWICMKSGRGGSDEVAHELRNSRK